MQQQAGAAVEILERLVAFDTTSSKSNLELIGFVSQRLRDQGIDCSLVESPDGSKKANLFATIGPSDRRGIGLSGHTDVVPVEGQTWQSDPFTLSERDGRLYGRGSCDMKGFLACVLAAVPMFRSRPLTTPVHLLFSYDEEVGCLGVVPMIAEFGRTLTAPRLIIVGEPTSMQVVDAHKGASRFVTTVTGHEAHSSLSHKGVNAIEYAARLIVKLRDIEAGLGQGEIARRFDPPRGTLHVGRIAGGTALNIVPKTCRFDWEMRPLPGSSIGDVLEPFEAFVRSDILPAMHAVDPETDVVTEVANDIAPFHAAPGAEAVSLALSLAGQNETFAVSYMTEASRFQEGGLEAAVVCGPGDIAQAHAPDEFIAVEQIERCMDFMARLADWAAG